MSANNVSTARQAVLNAVETIRVQAEVIADARDAQDAAEALDAIQTAVDQLRTSV